MIRFNYNTFDSLSGEHVHGPVLTGGYVRLNFTNNSNWEIGRVTAAIAEGLFFESAYAAREAFYPWASIFGIDAWEQPDAPKPNPAVP